MSSQALQQSLGEDEVFELVCDYLRTRKFYQAEQTLVQERESALNHETTTSATTNSLPKNQAEPSKLESLLERSYVTNFVSGELPPSPSKRGRTNLDGNEDIVLSDHDSDDDVEYGFSTKLVSFDACKDDPHGSATMPIYQTSTFAQKSATEFGAYDYTRSGNPTRAALERQMAEIEHGHRAFAFTSGMAALAAISRLAKSGDQIVLSDDSYGGTYRLLSKLTSRNGVTVKYVDLSGKDGPSNLRSVINTHTKLVMMESPTNPMQRICNISALAEVAHEFGTLLSVDNTMMSPILQNPLVLGADICMHSATKFVCGHSDTMSGIVIAKDPELCRELYFVQNAEGTGLAPMDCWLLLRGIKTMGLRVLTAQDNAMRIASYLSSHPAVTKVYYAGLPTSKNRDIHYAQARGAGSVITFCTGDLAFSQHIVSTTKLFKITVSFGSVNSLISLPGVMSHASIPEEVRKARSFPEDLIRLSIGIEDVQDLINDLQRAFQSFEK
ncbi:cystathionine beta-lyase [Thraustotheca clavata]|uniref:cysteine-S-conjugate beta-lyase n=1 Tax=Thraustotheca clavata TaxID=74557 RepID=A0A1W0A216_9STRA|nr:cystathionine beta-lyase [Thraustotheca clavata]